MDVRQNTGSLYPDKCFLSHLTYEDDNHLHTHLYYEIAYVLDGNIEHICNGEKKTLQPGNVILLRPGDLHTYKRFQNNSECTHRDLCISQDLFSSVCNFLSENLLEKIKKVHNACMQSYPKNNSVILKTVGQRSTIYLKSFLCPPPTR